MYKCKIWLNHVQIYYLVKTYILHMPWKYRVGINYRRISLRHNLSSKCRKIVKFVSITHSEYNIWNGLIVATAILWEKRKPVLEGNGCLTDQV
jgi:hypothetical protein